MEIDIINDYKQRSAFAQSEADKYKKLANTYSLYRLLLFGLFILTVCVAASINEIIIIALSLVALILSFGWLIKKQGRFDALKNYFLDVKKVNDNEINSIESRPNMYDNGSGFIDDQHNYSSDLDIYGNNSLFQLINRCATLPGISKLGTWLSVPSNKREVLLRQEAITEIAGKNEWKIDFQANLLFSLKQQKEQIPNLVRYLKIAIEIKGESWLFAYSKMAPWIMVALMITSVFFLPARYFVPVLAFFNYRLVSSRSDVIDKTDLIAGKIGSTLQHFVLAFKNIEGEEWESSYLTDISAKIKSDEKAVSVKIKQLSRLVHKLNYRLNNIVRLILNIFFIWDLRQIIAIEKWKKNNFETIEAALDVVAEFEALLSLAGLNINYPEWCFPEIAEGNGYTLVATELAHPLIGSKNRVANDYELNDTFKIDIVTGSNMAGKSTFLRTIGINAVLALCGAPVCAKYMRVSVVNIITYMRIKDSLNESTSTFKAELDRLQMLLAAVEKKDNKVFFLIDEMLRGTNSVDKYLGSKAIIEQLIRKKAVGMVATHDLQIAELETDHPDYVRNFYFDIQVKDGEMLFDYKIKDGACKTFNASLLLKQIGIDISS